MEQSTVSKNCLEFINNIKRSFSYVQVDEMALLAQSDTKEFKQSVIDALYGYAAVMTRVSNGKVKNNDFKFLNDITIMGLSLSVFKGENKNTKRMIVSHLVNILAAGIQDKDIVVPAGTLVPVPTGSAMKPSQDSLKELMSEIGKDNVLGTMIQDVSAKISSGQIDPNKLLATLLSNPSGAASDPAFKDIFDIVQRDVDKINPKSLDKIMGALKF
jgi:hypothetical protein